MNLEMINTSYVLKNPTQSTELSSKLVINQDEELIKKFPEVVYEKSKSACSSLKNEFKRFNDDEPFKFILCEDKRCTFFDKNGSEYTNRLPFEMSGVWCFSDAALFEKKRSTTSNNDISYFTARHALDIFAPVIFEIKDQINFGSSLNESIVHVISKHNLVITVNNLSGEHSIFLLRKALHKDYAHLYLIDQEGNTKVNPIYLLRDEKSIQKNLETPLRHMKTPKNNESPINFNSFGSNIRQTPFSMSIIDRPNQSLSPFEQTCKNLNRNPNAHTPSRGLMTPNNKCFANSLMSSVHGLDGDLNSQIFNFTNYMAKVNSDLIQIDEPLLPTHCLTLIWSESDNLHHLNLDSRAMALKVQNIASSRKSIVADTPSRVSRLLAQNLVNKSSQNLLDEQNNEPIGVDVAKRAFLSRDMNNKEYIQLISAFATRSQSSLILVPVKKETNRIYFDPPTLIQRIVDAVPLIDRNLTICLDISNNIILYTGCVKVCFFGPMPCENLFKSIAYTEKDDDAFCCLRRELSTSDQIVKNISDNWRKNILNGLNMENVSEKHKIHFGEYKEPDGKRTNSYKYSLGDNYSQNSFELKRHLKVSNQMRVDGSNEEDEDEQTSIRVFIPEQPYNSFIQQFFLHLTSLNDPLWSLELKAAWFHTGSRLISNINSSSTSDAVAIGLVHFLLYRLNFPLQSKRTENMDMSQMETNSSECNNSSKRVRHLSSNEISQESVDNQLVYWLSMVSDWRERKGKVAPPELLEKIILGLNYFLEELRVFTTSTRVQILAVSLCISILSAKLNAVSYLNYCLVNEKSYSKDELESFLLKILHCDPYELSRDDVTSNKELPTPFRLLEALYHCSEMNCVEKINFEFIPNLNSSTLMMVLFVLMSSYHSQKEAAFDQIISHIIRQLAKHTSVDQVAGEIHSALCHIQNGPRSTSLDMIITFINSLYSKGKASRELIKNFIEPSGIVFMTIPGVRSIFTRILYKLTAHPYCLNAEALELLDRKDLSEMNNCLKTTSVDDPEMEESAQPDSWTLFERIHEDIQVGSGLLKTISDSTFKRHSKRDPLLSLLYLEPTSLTAFKDLRITDAYTLLQSHLVNIIPPIQLVENFSYGKKTISHLQEMNQSMVDMFTAAVGIRTSSLSLGRGMLTLGIVYGNKIPLRINYRSIYYRTKCISYNDGRKKLVDLAKANILSPTLDNEMIPPMANINDPINTDADPAERVNDHLNEINETSTVDNPTTTNSDEVIILRERLQSDMASESEDLPSDNILNSAALAMAVTMVVQGQMSSVTSRFFGSSQFSQNTILCPLTGLDDPWNYHNNNFSHHIPIGSILEHCFNQISSAIPLFSHSSNYTFLSSLLWPEFHNGVATGLTISKNAKVSNNWILQNRHLSQCNTGPTLRPFINNSEATNNENQDGTPKETSHDTLVARALLNSGSAGLLLGLGLNGHFAKISTMEINFLLKDADDMTSMAIILGLCASKRKSRNRDLLRLLTLHYKPLLLASTSCDNYVDEDGKLLDSLFSQGYNGDHSQKMYNYYENFNKNATDLHIPPLCEAASLMGLGLLFQASSHRYVTNLLFDELSRQFDDISSNGRLLVTSQLAKNRSNEEKAGAGLSGSRKISGASGSGGFAGTCQEMLSTTAGFALGLVLFQSGEENNGIKDLKMFERLSGLIFNGQMDSSSRNTVSLSSSGGIITEMVRSSHLKSQDLENRQELYSQPHMKPEVVSALELNSALEDLRFLNKREYLRNMIGYTIVSNDATLPPQCIERVSENLDNRLGLLDKKNSDPFSTTIEDEKDFYNDLSYLLATSDANHAQNNCSVWHNDNEQGTYKETYAKQNISNNQQLMVAPKYNADVHAAGSIVALALIYINTGEKKVLDILRPPSKLSTLETIRPDIQVLLSTAEGLVQWSKLAEDASIKEWLCSDLDVVTNYLHRVRKHHFDIYYTQHEMSKNVKFRKSKFDSEANCENHSESLRSYIHPFSMRKLADMLSELDQVSIESQYNESSLQEDCETICLAYLNIMTGRIFSLGLRHAGTCNEYVHKIAHNWCRSLINDTWWPPKCCEECETAVLPPPSNQPYKFPINYKPSKRAIYDSMAICLLADAMIMSGSGCLETFKLARQLREVHLFHHPSQSQKPYPPVNKADVTHGPFYLSAIFSDFIKTVPNSSFSYNSELPHSKCLINPSLVAGTSLAQTYGQQMFINSAIGLLFLGGCRQSLINSEESAALLFISFFPKLPVYAGDNWQHLQTFRHFYTLVTKNSRAITVDVNDNKAVESKITLTMKNGKKIVKNSFDVSSTLFDELEGIQVEVLDRKAQYWPLNITKDIHQWNVVKKMIEDYGVIYVKKKAINEEVIFDDYMKSISSLKNEKEWIGMEEIYQSKLLLNQLIADCYNEKESKNMDNIRSLKVTYMKKFIEKKTLLSRLIISRLFGGAIEDAKLLDPVVETFFQSFCFWFSIPKGIRLSDDYRCCKTVNDLRQGFLQQSVSLNEEALLWIKRLI